MKAATSTNSQDDVVKLTNSDCGDSDEQGSDTPLDPKTDGTQGISAIADAEESTSPRSAQVLNKITSKFTDTAMRLANESANTGFDAVDSLVTGLKHGLLDLRAVTGTFYTSSQTAFVTFNSSVSTSMAHQMFLSVEHHHMATFLAPDPDGIIWDNVDKVARNVDKRKRLRRFGYIYERGASGAL